MPERWQLRLLASVASRGCTTENGQLPNQVIGEQVLRRNVVLMLSWSAILRKTRQQESKVRQRVETS